MRALFAASLYQKDMVNWLCPSISDGVADEPYRRAADLLKEGAAGKVPLISLPPHGMLPRLLQKEMVRRNIVWRTAMETSSQDSVSNYVRNGLGAGLAVQTPELQRDSALRVLPRSGFPSLPIGVFWRGKLGEIAEVFVDELADRAKSIFSRPLIRNR
jgi:DNA-binding transcriptional LysR family regulator